MLKTLKSATRFFSPKEPQQKILSAETKAASFSASFDPVNGNFFTFANKAVRWMQYYHSVAPVGDGIDKIADKAAKIPLMLYAPDSQEAEMPVYKHPFLSLLKRPNPLQTQETFIREAIVHYTATGNNYLRVMGLINGDVLNRDPVELYNLRPDRILASNAVANGAPTYYQYTTPDGSLITFRKRLVKDSQGRFIEAFIEDGGFSQLYHFKNISTNYNYGYFGVYGDAPLQACEIQIGQFFEAAVYNYSLIVNGMSARKLFSLDSKEIFSQSQKDVLKKFIEENFSGAVNSGKSIVSPIPLKVDDLQIGLKDMDFKSLNEATIKAVYSKLNIPLPLTDTKDTSHNNMSVSELMFYDNAVLPALDNLCANLFSFPFQQRYKDADQFLRLGYNPTSIGALLPRIMDNVEKMKKVGDTSTNERREYMGMSRITNLACDEIYINNNMVPIGTDTNLIDTIGTDQQADKRKQAELLLKKQKNPDGTDVYSESQIKEFLERTPYVS